MKRTQMTLWGVILAFCIVLTGCSGTVVNFAAERDQAYDASRGREITASACGFQFWLFFPLMINDRQERAYTELVGQANGEYLTDIKVNERWIYAVLGTVYCTDMKATAYPIKTATPPQASAEVNR